MRDEDEEGREWHPGDGSLHQPGEEEEPEAHPGHDRNRQRLETQDCQTQDHDRLRVEVLGHYSAGEHRGNVAVEKGA